MAEYNRQNEIRLTSYSKLKVLETLGNGKYGVVYRAQHQDWGVVALKELIDIQIVPEKVKELLKREGDKLCGIGHPNIIKVQGLIMENRHYGLVLDYMPNGCLEDFLLNERVFWPLKCRMISQIVTGMNYLHRNDPAIIHRDLKSQNILVDGYFNIRISDFGISEWKTYSRQYSVSVSSRPCKKGTITHIPPESFMNVNLRANTKFDVYSFGIVVWEIMTEKLPFSEATDEQHLHVCVIEGQRPDEHLIPTDAPKFLCDIMKKSWHQEPEKRPSFAELKSEVDVAYRPYEENAKDEELQLLLTQRARKPQSSQLVSQVEEDVIATQTASLRISDRVPVQADNTTSSHSHKIGQNVVNLPDDVTTNAVERATVTDSGRTDYGGNIVAQKEAVAREHRDRPPIRRFTPTDELATNYGTHGVPVLPRPVQRFTETLGPEVDYGFHGGPRAPTAQPEQGSSTGADQTAGTAAQSEMNQTAVLESQRGQPAARTSANEVPRGTNRTTGNEVPQGQNRTAGNEVPRHHVHNVGGRPHISTNLPEDVATDAASLSYHVATDACPPKEDPFPSTHKAYQESAEAARNSYSSVPSGHAYPPPGGPPFDPALGCYPTGPDNFPGQHQPVEDGQGYWYYPMPNAQPIYIAIPPNPAFKDKSNYNPSTAGGNRTPQIIHTDKNGSTTTIVNLNHVDGIQIGDKNVMHITTSGSKKSKPNVTRTKVTKKLPITESTRKITDGDARIVALHLGKDWKMLARTLGLYEGQIDSINHDYQVDGLTEKIYQMLRMWRSTKGSAATAKTLAHKLLSIHRPDVAAKIPNE